jgi:hypothetical protein
MTLSLSILELHGCSARLFSHAAFMVHESLLALGQLVSHAAGAGALLR